MGRVKPDVFTVDTTFVTCATVAISSKLSSPRDFFCSRLCLVWSSRRHDSHRSKRPASSLVLSTVFQSVRDHGLAAGTLQSVRRIIAGAPSVARTFLRRPQKSLLALAIVPAFPFFPAASLVPFCVDKSPSTSPSFWTW